MLLRKVHRYLASLRYITRTLRRVEGILVDVVVLTHRANDMVDSNLLLRKLHIDLEDILGERDSNLTAEERRISNKR